MCDDVTKNSRKRTHKGRGEPRSGEKRELNDLNRVRSAMDRVLDELGNGKDLFSRAMALRILTRVEW
jgi:hypothetical protein